MREEQYCQPPSRSARLIVRVTVWLLFVAHFFTSMTSNRKTHISVFYNVFADSKGGDIALNRARDYVREQMSLMKPTLHKVFVRSVGAQFKVENARLIRHDEQGDEVGTLKLLWDYCQKSENPNQKVVYIHNKGSFHPRKENDLLRQWLTRAALSEECSNMPQNCNVCSWRFSPYPHPHNSGNMWTAKCKYIQKLMDPTLFELRMSQLYPRKGSNPFLGVGRFAAEHWVHSHPSVQPCDVSTSNYRWAYKHLPEDDSFWLETFPRNHYNFQEHQFDEGDNYDPFHTVEDRLKEYDFLYNETVPKSWYGWKFYHNNSLKFYFRHK